MMSNLHWHGYGELFVIDAEYVEDFHIYIYVHLHNDHLAFIFISTFISTWSWIIFTWVLKWKKIIGSVPIFAHAYFSSKAHETFKALFQNSFLRYKESIPLNTDLQMIYTGDLYKSCRNWNQLKSSALCNPPGLIG